MPLTVGIAGITGKFARRLVSHLVKYPDVTIHGYCRDPSKVPASLASLPQIHIIQGDAFDSDALDRFVEGCDVVICCYLGDDKLMVDGQKALIDACERGNVPRYFASDWALDYTKLEFGELFVKDPMKHVKAYLETKKVEGVHVLIGGFMEPVFSPHFNFFDPKTTTFRFWGDGDEILEGTTYDNAAEFTAALALDPDATGIQKFLGGRATVRELAQTYEKVYSVKVTLERLGSLDDLYKKMHALRSENPDNVFSYMFLFFYYYWVNGQTLVGPETQADKYPNVKPVSWEDFFSNCPAEKLPGSFGALFA